MVEIEMGIQHQYFAIEDNPFEDILMSLEGLCAWVDNALVPTAYKPKVLVHCIQGVSRSGAVIVALLMRSRSLNYESALALARKSRAVIAPNEGFADQLRLWQKMNYSISEADGVGLRKTKLQYEEWRIDRGILLTKDEEMRHKVMRDFMDDMAIKFGQPGLSKG
jgi:dual specificity phosphatase 12